MIGQSKTLRFGVVWDDHRLPGDAPVGPAWLDEERRYETEVLSKRQ